MKVLGFLCFVTQVASISHNIMNVDESQFQLQLPLWCEDQNITLPFTIMRDFLASSTSENISLAAAEAAANLTRNLPTGNYSGEDDYLRSASFYVTGLFDTVEDIAMQTPAGHIYHYRLVALLSALKEQPQPAPELRQMIESDYPFDDREFRWDELPSFSYSYYEQFSYKSRFEPWTSQDVFSDCWTPTQWLNLNTFVSLLVAEEVVENDLTFHVSGLLVLWHTLEFRRSANDLEDNIPSAATWIILAGSWMHKHRELALQIPWVPLEDEVLEYDGPKVGFNDERWQFWKSKFQYLSARDDLTVDARMCAQKAADHMASLDGPSREDKPDL
jgi:hypothetical protein